MSSPREIEIKIPYCPIKAQVWGDSKSEKILALHGWLDSSASFAPLAKHLPEVEIIAVDLPGHGHSAHKPEGMVLHFIDIVYDIIAIADALGLEKFKVMGHSMGAGILSLLAGTIPDRIRDMVLIEGLGPLSSPPEESVERLQTHLRQWKRMGQKKFPIYKTIEEAVAARMTAGDISDQACRILAERGLRKYEGGMTWRSDARLRVKSAHSFTEEQVQAFLRAILCPVLLVRALPGLESAVLRIEPRRDLIKNLTYREIDGNHHVHMDKPQEIAKMILDFYSLP